MIRKAVIAACVLLPFDGVKGEEAESMFSLSGFGTLGVVHSSEHHADFVSAIFSPDGAGYTREWSAEIDSRLGVQLTGRLTSRLTATVQLVSEQEYDEHYVPQVEWANIKFQFTPQFSARIGRTALASFLASDFRKVGYANPWVRPPYEVYGLVPVVSADGVDATYTLNTGPLTHSLHVGFGQTDSRSPDGTRNEARDLWILSDTVEFGPTTLRLVYTQTALKIDLVHDLIESFRLFGPQGSALADRYDPDSGLVTFLGIAGMHDPGKWFVMAEWGTVDFRSVLGRRTSWYVSGGYRISALTPYATYAETTADSELSSPGLDTATLPPPLAAPAAGLNAALNGILGSLPVQKTITVGARWDFMQNVALKLQYDHIDLGAGSAGTLGNLQPGFLPGGVVNLFSATIDFVW